MERLNEINVRPDKDRLINLLNDVKKGKIVVPKFQRDIVWNVKQRLDLFDSISKGFPIGSLLFWNPEVDDFGFNKKIGPYFLDLNNKKYSYIIDGYQRITTLFSALNNPNDYDNDKVDKNILNEYIVYYSLEDEEFFHVLKSKKDNLSVSNIPLYVLVDTFEFLTFTKRIQEELEEESSVYINRAKKLATSLLDYEVAFVNIHGGTIQDAVEIFSRINSKGSDMSPMWMLSALTYEDGDDGFKFSDEIDDLKLDLKEFNFEDIKTDIILQCIRSSTGKLYIDTKTDTLAKRNDFKSLSLSTFENIYQAVDFLYYRVNVINSSLLPYNLQLIFITEFFRLVDRPSDNKLRELEKWFWQTTYSSYFTIYSLSKQRKAFAQFQDYCRGLTDKILYKVSEQDVFEVVEFPSKMNYGSVRSKAFGLYLIKYLLENSNIENYEFDDFYSLSKQDKDSVLLFPKFVESVYAQGILGDRRGKSIKDYSFLLEGDAPNFDYEANFIDDEVLNLKDSLALLKERRYNLISREESIFVESLDIEYSFTDRYEIDHFALLSEDE